MTPSLTAACLWVVAATITAVIIGECTDGDRGDDEQGGLGSAAGQHGGDVDPPDPALEKGLRARRLSQRHGAAGRDAVHDQRSNVIVLEALLDHLFRGPLGVAGELSSQLRHLGPGGHQRRRFA